ncbi:MAG: hypothetical protein N4J56_004242 [Chroococcidiopsis sp. SAG 2025]|nr:hypothetical protein [Chroococcidiopsis sp. SAG 2025]
MKHSHLVRAIGTGILVASAAILPACTPEPRECKTGFGLGE